MFTLIVLLSLFAGALTTLAGMGGGLILTLGLAAALDPLTALTITAPALLLGNAHRLWLYRAELDRRTAGRVALGAVPGALAGGLAATALPPLLLQVGMVLIAGLAAARILAGLRWSPPRSWLLPGGAFAGFVTATSGGGGLILGPLLLARGLSGPRYIATASVAAISVHVGRLLGYGLGDASSVAALRWGILAALAIAAGNLAGSAARRRVPQGWGPRIELGAVVTCLSLSLLGLT